MAYGTKEWSELNSGADDKPEDGFDYLSRKAFEQREREQEQLDSNMKALLLWMHKNNIDSVIPFFVIQAGRDGKIPHWTNGKELYNVSELIEKYYKEKS